MSSLRGKIVSTSKNQRVMATVEEILGGLTTVRICSSGKLLTGLRSAGGLPNIGDRVYLDYATNPPMVLSISGSVTTTVPQTTYVRSVARADDEITPGQNTGIGSGVSVHITVSATQPANPAEGDLWVDIS